jgi:hypothetical protein
VEQRHHGAAREVIERAVFLPEDHAGVLPQGAIKFRFVQNVR